MYSKKVFIFVFFQIFVCILVFNFIFSRFEKKIGFTVTKGTDKIFSKLEKIQTKIDGLNKYFCFFNFPEEDNNLELKKRRSGEALYFDWNSYNFEKHEVFFEKNCQVFAVSIADDKKPNSINIFFWGDRNNISFFPKDIFVRENSILKDDLNFLKNQLSLIYLFSDFSSVILFQFSGSLITGVLSQDIHKNKIFFLFVENKSFLFREKKDFLEIVNIFVDKSQIQDLIEDFELNTFSPSVSHWEKKYNNPKTFGLYYIE